MFKRFLRYLMGVMAPTLIVSLGLSVLTTAMADDPRGIRNNNPGNIEEIGIPWQGRTTDCQDQRFACFSSPEYGIRALTINLLSYHYVHGIDSLEGVVKRWMPSPENNHDEILSNFDALNNGASQITNENLHELVTWFIIVENGTNPYPEEMIKEVVEDALSARNYYDSSFHFDLGVHQVQGEADRDQEIGSRINDGSGKQINGNPEIGQARFSMDTTSNRFDVDLLYSRTTEVNSSVWMDRRNRYLRVY